MRGFGDYHRAVVAERLAKTGDPRPLQLIRHLREALDVLEQMMVHPWTPPAPEPPPPPRPVGRPPKERPDVQLNPNKLMYRVKEVQALCGFGNSTFYNLVKRGDLRPVKVGSLTLVPAEQLREWLENLKPSNSGTRHG
jgi:excisionase family DNA binding protein